MTLRFDSYLAARQRYVKMHSVSLYIYTIKSEPGSTITINSLFPSLSAIPARFLFFFFFCAVLRHQMGCNYVCPRVGSRRFPYPFSSHVEVEMMMMMVVDEGENEELIEELSYMKWNSHSSLEIGYLSRITSMVWKWCCG